MLRILCFLILMVGSEVSADAQWKAVSGDTYQLNGSIVKLEGVYCPSPDTENGLEAKRIANTFLRSGTVNCNGFGISQASWSGDCTLKGNNGKTLSQVMIDSGYCNSVGSAVMDGLSETSSWWKKLCNKVGLCD